MKHLQNLFSTVHSSTEEVLKEIISFDHPLVTILTVSLQEQKEVLEKLLPELEKEEEVKLDTVKEYISIVYHNHEISYPMFQSWKRAGEWMNLSSQSAAERLEPAFPEMKRNLEAAAEELKNIYGAENIKYVVPSFYIPSVQKEA
ncbi:hypothetical protein [Peribacillus kribbensis]|uniref:hypothetical protein n=1 Tax=Peribacillus kribbensis TaxID=356658 RepID=UPI00047C21D7|nr:hypothetical protein [Peribacillus kribbensis]